MAQYLASQTARSQSAGGGTRQFTIFPADDDSFALEVSGNTAAATVHPSGATWTLALPAAAAPHP
jgi:hypothetical protein